MRPARGLRGFALRLRQASVRAEVLSSLGVVMLLALLVLVVAAFRNHEQTLRAVLGPALLAESRDPGSFARGAFPDAVWWRVSAAGGALPIGLRRADLGPRELALAAAARTRSSALLDFGAVWEPILFAAPPTLGGDVLVARISAAASSRLRARPAAVFAALALADAVVFGAFGFVLLQVRVVAPFERLAALAREIGESEGPVAAQLTGPREARAVADALNEMSVALAGRTKELSGAVVELRDTNQRLRQTRAGLERAERLASVGRLAAGVAHEVGNPLGAILAFAELVLRDPGISAASRAQLERLLREGERVRGTLRRLLDLSRPVRAEIAPLELARVAREAISLVAAQRKYADISFVVEVSEGLPLALGDPDVTHQVLLNLLLNAAEAVGAQPERRVLVALCERRASRRRGEAEYALPAGAPAYAVECVIADTGCGIAEEDRERVFDPFFTTRTSSDGTGLGLPNALRMAEEQGGSLGLTPPPAGYRTAFALQLRAAASASAPIGAARSA